LTARHRVCADSMSLNAIATPAAREPGPLVTRWRERGEDDDEVRLRHVTCGTPLEVRWRCPTCDTDVDLEATTPEATIDDTVTFNA
jgi:hypothetical protein